MYAKLYLLTQVTRSQRSPRHLLGVQRYLLRQPLHISTQDRYHEFFPVSRPLGLT